ncbi:MAG TPA: glycerol kinase GlpK [Polyangiaceae bacterium]|nr:glycerol kinase GlpK [Polyangiaceae bacterium]
MKRHLLAIDQGTTGSTVLIMDLEGRTLGRATREFHQYFPAPGLVEHDPEEIWASVCAAAIEALAAASLGWDAIAALGITNQRETTLVWERATGKPIHRAIVWQDRRTAARCAELEKGGHGPRVREITGLVLDPYFSGTKVAWLLDNVPGARARAEKGELCFGTVDAYLIWRLTRGEVHATDVTNASRTLLMNLRTLAWDEEMCGFFGVPRAILPAIVSSAGKIAATREVDGFPAGVPIAGIAGDQQAALFGQACFAEGDVKCTYGTGAFVLIHTGARPVQSRFGLLTTVGWKIGSEVVYALEGSSFIAGAAVQWLRDGLGLIEKASDIESLARQVPSSEGVTFVPALAGLGAPYWDAGARGLITGLTRGTRAAHLARATLEAIAHQVDDLVRAMADDLGAPVRRMRVDGGAAANDLLMEFQGNLSDLVIERPVELESTARGAAMLAGLGVSLFASPAQAANMAKASRVFQPAMPADERSRLRRGWAGAVERARSAPQEPAR